MADVRTLLKAKRQESRVSHPLATYTSTGQLRCVACGTNVKHASAWEGHVGSKVHRVNAARLREVQQLEAEAARIQENRKRRTEEAEGADEDEGEDDNGDFGREEAVLVAKKRKLDTTDVQPTLSQTTASSARGFPADFFSDPSKAPPPLDTDDEGEEESHPTHPRPPAQTQAASTALDSEWAKFQQTVLNAPDKSETYERATVFAEPILAAEVPEGFPPRNGEESKPEPEASRLPTEEEVRGKKEQEERELIMDRLMEEERAQEEADAKVSMLKQRLENLRKQRKVAKAGKVERSNKS